MKNFNNQFATQKLREDEVEETSMTGGEGAFLTKASAQRQTPKPTSGYKSVKGFRPGHTKLKVVQPKDLWGLNEEEFQEVVSRLDKEKVDRLLKWVKDRNEEIYRKFLGWMVDPYPHDYEEFAAAAQSLSEVGVKPQPQRVMNYTTGEKVEVGQRVKVNTQDIQDGYGEVSGFTQDPQGDDVILVNVERDRGSSQLRKDIPVPLENIELSQPTEKDTVNEGIREIRLRNESQQFTEAMKQVNRRLKEVNDILEYAESLKSTLSETNQASSLRLMEKMKRGMIKAYTKMKRIEK